MATSFNQQRQGFHIPHQAAGTFLALKHPNYRLWFIGQLVSLVGTWMQSTAQSYLIYTLTNSPAFLGYVAFASGLPTWLFTLYGGVIADRIPRRKLLIITQSTMMVLAFILTALVATNLVQPWEIIVMAFLLGIANAFDAPARQSFVMELVPHEDLTNAIALNSMMFNMAIVIGPAVAGMAYALIGPGWCFAINGASFIAVIIGLLMMNLAPLPPRTVNQNAVDQVKEGFIYVKEHKNIALLIINLGIISLVGMGAVALMPAWAVNVLKGDANTNGWLLSARGLGSLVGALLIASLSRYKLRGRMWSIGSLVLPVVWIIFAFVRWMPGVLITMVFIGFSYMFVVNTSNSMVQTEVTDDLRGRVMGIYVLVFFGLAPVGSLVAGLMAEKLTEPVTVAICGAALLVYSVYVYFRMPQMRHHD
jgi:MFS family permease